MNVLIIAACMAFGAFVYDIWEFLKLYNATKGTPNVEKFSWTKFIMTIAPSIVLGFLAGLAMAVPAEMDLIQTLVFCIMTIVSGYGLAHAGYSFGVNDFFD